MGATTYIEEAKGHSIEKVFEDLVSDAVMYHGRDSYNGTISTTSLGHRVNFDPKKDPESSILDDDTLFSEKWTTNYADLGISHYEAFTPQWVPNEKTPRRQKGVKTLQRFQVMTVGRTRLYQTYTTLGEAKREAKQLSLSSEKDTLIFKARSNGEQFLVGEMKLTSDRKEYKSARKAKTKIYKPIHKFMLFVYASC